MPEKSPGQINQATVAGGCFWCIEAAFLQFPGVIAVTSGYTGGTVNNPTYQQVSTGTTGHFEAVRLTFDPTKTTYQKLLEHYFLQIDPTDKDGQFADRGPQYQTAIFYHYSNQHQQAQAYIKELNQSGKYPKPIVTQVIKAAPFYPAEDYHQHYALKNPLRYNLYKHASGRK